MADEPIPDFVDTTDRSGGGAVVAFVTKWRVPLLIVAIFIALLAPSAIKHDQRVRLNGRYARARVQTKNLETAILMCRAEFGKWPFRGHPDPLNRQFSGAEY